MSYIKVVNLIALIVVTVLFNGCSNEIIQPQGPANIIGKVVDYSGIEMNNVQVSINYGQPVSVNNDGSFLIPVTSSPYNLLIFDKPKSTYIEYVGLRAMFPIVTDWVTGSYFSNLNDADIIATFPEMPFGKGIILRFISDINVINTGGGAPYGDTSMSLRYSWSPALPSVIGTLLFLEVTKANDGRILTFDKFGKKTITLNNAGTIHVRFSNQDIQYLPGTSTISVEINPHSNCIGMYPSIVFDGYPFNTDINISSYAPYPLGSFTVPATLPIPFKIKIRASWQNDTSSGGSTNWIFANPGDITFMNPSDHLWLLYPTNDTVGVTFDTHFSYAQGNGHEIFVLTAYSSYVFPPLSISVISTSSDVQLPRLDLLGINLPLNKRFYWSVSKYSSFRSIDEFASVKKYTNNTDFTSIVYSQGRSFVSKPDSTTSRR